MMSVFERPDSPPLPPPSLANNRLKDRLKLRNARLRAPEILPARNSTPLPRALSDGLTWTPTPTSDALSHSGRGMLSHVSDAENVSPPDHEINIHRDASTGNTGSTGIKLGLGHMRKSSAILQEVVNSSSVVRRTKNARARVTSDNFLTPKANGLCEDVLIAPSPQAVSTVKPPRSIRLRSKMGRPRRSTSGEMRKYVDRLEAELDTANEERNSPTQAREQSTKIRLLNIETKRQERELADWDKKYEERIQEEVERHQKIEVGLRARLRTLEHDLVAKAFRVQELDCDLEFARQNMAAVEAANVNLEKRLEIMSELLAASPTKLDLHIDASGRPRHGRQKSMLPRLPAVGPLMSPVRQSFGFPITQHASPSPSRISLPMSPARYSPGALSETDQSTPDAMQAAIADAQPQPWPDQHAKPARRMRRFCGGSLGPKPLILPSTSHHEPAPSSPINGMTPEEDKDFATIVQYAMEHPQTRPGSPARRWSKVSFGKPENDSAGYTSEDEMLDLFLDMSPQHLAKAFDDVRTPSVGRSEMRDVSSEASRTFSRNFSSLGSMPLADGPTLEEELAGLRGFDLDDDLSQIDEDEPEYNTISSPPNEAMNFPTALSGTANSRLVSIALTSVSTTPVAGTIMRADSINSLSTIDNLGSYFSGFLRAPILLAKHLVETAQNRARLPQPLFSVQWWLVGLLIGPMAKRELLRAKELSHSCCDRDTGRKTPLLKDSNDGSEYETTPKPKRCSHPMRYKHSPWLWLKFSFTLAVAVGVAFKEGPSSLLKDVVCACVRN